MFNNIVKKHLQIHKLQKHLKTLHQYEIKKMIAWHSVFKGLHRNNEWVGFSPSSEIYSVDLFEISELF